MDGTGGFGRTRTDRQGARRRPRSDAAAALVLALLAVACAGGGPGGDPGPGDLPAEARPDAPDVPGDPGQLPDTPTDARPEGPADLPPDGTDAPDPADPAGPPDPGPDGSDDGDAGDGAPTDLAPGDAPPGDGDRDEGPACEPDAGPCPCTTHEDCPEGTFCDGTACAEWLCIPGATSCLQTLRILCDRDGGGYIVQQDCDDRNACTTGDGCVQGRCLEQGTVDCDDGDPCTRDGCDPASAACTHDPADGPCDDGDPCTVQDHCLDGACVPGGALPCSDGNPCTDDLCTALLGCVHLPNRTLCNGTPDPCAQGARCGEGTCQALARDCDDGDPCTLDACDGGACLHEDLPGCRCGAAGDCDDGVACTGDACDGGRCVHLPVPGPGCCATEGDCDDGDPCTTDLCPAGGPACRHEATGTSACCVPPALRATFEGTLDAFAPDPPLDPEADAVGWRAGTAPGGGGALYFGNAAGTGYGTGGRVAGAALSPEIALPAGQRSTLTFRTWQDVETVPGQDPFTVDVLAGGKAHRAWERPAGFTPRSWAAVQVDLSALGGRAVRVRVAFDTGDGQANDGQGVYVDDLSVASPCQPVSCDVEADCVSLGWHGGCAAGACGWDVVMRPLAGLGGGPGQAVFSGPSDVALAPDGQRIFASDRDAHVVRVLDPEGRLVHLFGGYGPAPGSFSLPRGLAAEADRLWVADSGNHRVQALTHRGVPILVLGGKGADPGRFQEPKGVALSPDGQTVWVADSGNHRVQGLTPWGVVRAVAGSYGRNAGQLRSPSCVVPLSDGRVLVCDTQNNRLQVFREDGAFEAVVAPLEGPGLLQPYGAAEAPDGSLWVSDTYGHRLVRLDRSGRVRDQLGASGTALGQFRYPLGLESTADGGLWVVDEGNVRLVRYGLAPIP